MATYGPLDAIRDQVRWARRRHNAFAVQSALYPLLGVMAVLAAVVVLAALHAARAGFACVLVGAVAAFAATLASAARRGRRGWLSWAAAPAWFDRRAGLEERVSTLLALPDLASSAFGRLLLAQTFWRVRPLRPERLVPRVVPWAALAGALAGIAMLATVLELAPVLRPLRVLPLRASPAGETSGLGPRARGASAPYPSGQRAARRRRDAIEAGPDEHREPIRGESLSRLAGDLQAWLRRTVGGGGAENDTVTNGLAGRAQSAPAGPGQAGAHRPAQEAMDRDLEAAPEGRAAQMRSQGAPLPSNARVPGSGDGGPGAGSGTDPRLYTATPRPAPSSSGRRFELPIAAPVHARPGDGRAQGDSHGPTDPDRSPSLAAAQRADDPVPRMPLPPRWQNVVRRVFARDAVPAP